MIMLHQINGKKASMSEYMKAKTDAMVRGGHATVETFETDYGTIYNLIINEGSENEYSSDIHKGK